MNRQQKEQVIASLNELLAQSEASFIINYRGLSVAQLQSLRNNLRKDGGTVRVAKARLMKRATEGVDGIDELVPHLKEQIALVFAQKETPAVAKTLHTFAKENEALDIVAGFFEKQVLDKDSVVAIASLPSRDVLLAMLLGGMQAPVSGFARVLNMLILRLLFVLKQIAEKKQ